MSSRPWARSRADWPRRGKARRTEGPEDDLLDFGPERWGRRRSALVFFFFFFILSHREDIQAGDKFTREARVVENGRVEPEPAPALTWRGTVALNLQNRQTFGGRRSAFLEIMVFCLCVCV